MAVADGSGVYPATQVEVTTSAELPTPASPVINTAPAAPVPSEASLGVGSALTSYSVDRVPGLQTGSENASEMEEGQVTDSGKTPTPEAPKESSVPKVKHEIEEDDDLVLLDGSGASDSRASGSANLGKRRTSIPLAVNVGSTYSGRTASITAASQSVEPRASTSTLPSSREDRQSTRRRRTDSREGSSKRKRSSRRRRETDSPNRYSQSPESLRDRRSSRRPGGRAASRKERTSRPNGKKRRRRRSYTSSSESYSSSSSSSEGSGSSYSSSSYTSSRSRSYSPDRRRRRQARHSRQHYIPQHQLPYSAVPVPMPMQMQMQPPVTMLPTQTEEELSRQQLSHMYRNMPSNPAELNVRPTAAFTASPPRAAQNSFAFPGQSDGHLMGSPNQSIHMRGVAGNIHPARAQAMASTASRPYEPSPPYNGHDTRGRGQPGGHSLPARPNATGWPDPPPPAPRRNAGWPDDRPNRPRPDKPPSQSTWGAANTRSQPARDVRAESSSKASGSGWGDSASTVADPWGDTPASTAPASASVNDPWGSPGAAPSTAPAEKPATSAWGGDLPAKPGSSVWD